MTGLLVFNNGLFEIEAKLEDGTVLFDAEKVAKCLGITQIKNNKEYIRWERVNEYLNLSPQTGENLSPSMGKGSLIPESMVYKLAFKASNEVAEKFQDWLAIEVLPSIRKTGSYSVPFDKQKETFEMEMLGAKLAAEMLLVDTVSKIKMIEKVHKAHGVGTSHLPVYVEEELKVSLTQLLKDNGVTVSAVKVNKKLVELGILEVKQRAATKGTKEFKALTSKGLYYGANAVSPNNSKETQPLYYPSKFKELLRLI